VWVKNWVGRRGKYGASNTLLKELKDEDPVAYRNILRLGGAWFDALLQMIDGMIKKKDTKMRMAIPTPSIPTIHPFCSKLFVHLFEQFIF
jgi:hypothetical protein